MPSSTQTHGKHIGLFGGSFNPIHFGHLQAASAVLSALKLDTCRFILAARSPLKPKPLVGDSHRIAMLKLALSQYKYFDLDTQELQRKGSSFTIDTLNHIQKKAPENYYYFMLGMDAWLDIERWKDWKKIADQCHLVVMTRPGYSRPSLNDYWRKKRVVPISTIRQFKTGKLAFVSIPDNDASSGKIRDRVHNHLSVNSDLPTKVAQYITEHKLYSQNQ